MAFNAESRAQPGDVVLSPAVWNLVKEYFKFSNDPFDPKEGGFAFLDLSKSKKMLTNVSVVVYTTHTNRRSRSYDLETLFKSVQNYIPSAVLPFLNDMEKWASELRKITCMFVNLGFSPEVMATEEEGHQEKIHEVMVAVNESIYNFEGSLNKFLMDDKGFTLIAVFGLRPLSHNDDSIRGVLAALLLCSRVHELGFPASVGVSTGIAFCGIIGNNLRREYTILGDMVNLAARLMSDRSKHKGGVCCDQETYERCKNHLAFDEVEYISLKGKSKPVEVYSPSPRPGILRPEVRNWYWDVYEYQMDCYEMNNLVMKEFHNSPMQRQRRRLDQTPGAIMANAAKDKKSSRKTLHKVSKVMTSKPFRKMIKSQFYPNKKKKSKDGAQIMMPIEDEEFAFEEKTYSSTDCDMIHNARVHLPNGYIVHVSCSGFRNLYQVKQRLFALLAGRNLSPEGRIFDYVFIANWNKVGMYDESISLEELFDTYHEKVAPDMDLVLQRLNDKPEISFLKNHREQLLEKLHELLSASKGGTVIIIGEIGLGKSLLLESVMSSARAQVVCTVANPYKQHEAFSSCRHIFLQLLDNHPTQVGGGRWSDYSGGTLTTRRTETIIELLKDHDAGTKRAIPFAARLLDLDLPEPEEQQAMTKREWGQLVVKLLTRIMQRVCQIRSVVCIVDDLAFVDIWSWNLFLSLHRSCNNLLMVMATEPMNRFFMGALSSHAPKQYKRLLCSPRTIVMRLKSFPPRAIQDIASEEFCSDKLSPQLRQILTERSNGNPVICRAYCHALIDQNIVKVEPLSLKFYTKSKKKMRNKLSCSSSISCKTLDSLQVPSKVMDILGSRFGRLTNFQQMILKVAAILGWQFHYEELRSTYPIHQHKYRIAEELVILVNSTVIRKIARANQRVAYEFSFGFMRNFLQSMVLGSQKNVLEKLRLEQNKAYDVFRAYLYVYLDYANGGSSWTVMWGELSESSLWLYESKSSRYPHTVIDMCSSKLMENPAVAYEEFENEDRDRRRSLFPDSRPRLSDSGSADDSSHQVSFVVETNLWLCTIRSKQEEENDSPGMDTQVSFKDLVNSPGLMQRMTVPSSPDSLTLKHPT
eukprot:201477_1